MQPGGTRDYPFFWMSVNPPDYAEAQAMRSHGAAPAPSSDVRRRRAESRATVVDNGPDFQDVYDGRRQDMPPQRLPSIHEPARGTGREPGVTVERLESRRSTAGRHRQGFLARQAPMQTNDMV